MGPGTLEPHKQAEIASRTAEFMEHEATKPFGWASAHWVKWATIAEALPRLGVASGARVLDVGCGSGWTSLFLAESGYDVTAFDLVPANVELTLARARRWQVPLRAVVADMEDVDLGGAFDAVLVFDSLHHSWRQAATVSRVSHHLRPGGWALFGEPSWLHGVSPHARRTHRERGWTERGVTARGLRRDCTAAGLGSFRRFFEPTQPYESRTRGFAWQLLRLAAANVAVAPQAQVWLAAQRV
jgi:2-polyprenyl-3-methyl-5-hydroxy-6-metoxy-1,4-benzoquinol methylase